MPLHIVSQDITGMNTDAIVNAANERLQNGGGVCGAIFEKAGLTELQEACDKIGHCPTGSAVITPGFKLKAKYVIHAVGPVWRGGTHHEEQQLKGCYLASLKLADENHLESIAFPLISSGIYGYPKDKAIEAAVEAIQEFLADHEMDVSLVILDRTIIPLESVLRSRLHRYVGDNYRAEAEQLNELRKYREENTAPKAGVYYSRPAPGPGQDLAHALQHARGETFSHMLLRLIDERGLKDAEVYRRANMDRKLFSKIRSNEDYHPKKRTILALAVALRLEEEETEELLKSAGFALSSADKTDVIVSFFIHSRIYDIITINEALFTYEQEPIS
jgi:O-acetyl-ADP-ribose deacetylase (regulator of RNase III)